MVQVAQIAASTRLSACSSRARDEGKLPSLAIHSRLHLVHRRSQGANAANAGLASDADSTAQRGGLPREQIYERQEGLVEQQGRLEERRGGFEEREQRAGSGLLCPSSSLSHTRHISAVPQRHWHAELEETRVRVCRLLSVLYSDMAVKELDKREKELWLKLESLLPLLSPQRDAISPPSEIPLNSASPSTINNSGAQLAHSELPLPELPAPPGPADDPSAPRAAPEGENDGGLDALTTLQDDNPPLGHYGDANSSAWPGEFFEFDTDDAT